MRLQGAAKEDELGIFQDMWDTTAEARRGPFLRERLHVCGMCCQSSGGSQYAGGAGTYCNALMLSQLMN
jgi:hypothetical protein